MKTTIEMLQEVAQQLLENNKALIAQSEITDIAVQEQYRLNAETILKISVTLETMQI